MLVSFGMLTGSARQVPGQARSVPSQNARQQAAALIGELYRDELLQALTDPSVKLKLAHTFLQEARDTADNPAGKYVLLREAATLASQAGDGFTALRALGELGQSFDLPPDSLLQLKIEALQVASKGAATPEAYQGTLDAALTMLEDALAEDALEVAAALGAIADSAGKKLRNVPLVSSIRKRNEEIQTLQAEFASVKPFVETLKKDPTDARANLEAGKYFALVKGHWDKGLPLLLKGSDPRLKEAAALDVADPPVAQTQVRLGDLWAAAAASFKGAANNNLLLRACHWYQEALASGDSAQRAQTLAKLLAANDQLPPDCRAGEIAVELKRFSGHVGPVFGVALSGNGSRLASAGADSVVRLWDTKNAKEVRRFDGHTGPAWCVALSADGRRVVSGGFDKSIRIWDAVSGLEIKRLAGHDDYVRAVVPSRDGRLILSAGDDRLARLWDASSAGERKSFSGHDHFVFGAAMARDGKRGLTASLDRTARLWDMETGQTLKILAGHGDTVLAVAFTPDGRQALTGSTDKTLKLWDLESGQAIHTLRGHSGYVYTLAISPDGRRALSSGQDGKLILWDLTDGKMVREMECPGGAIWSVSFSGDGRLAATGSNDGALRVWGNKSE
jgi:hypothetical protein